jgi:hypothetical protein
MLISDLSALSDSNGLTDCDIQTRTYVANRLDYLTVVVIILNALSYCEYDTYCNHMTRTFSCSDIFIVLRLCSQMGSSFVLHTGYCIPGLLC